jgi:alkyldihydroxyacetonephosphate synthase
MTRILQVDKENMLILVETGITGSDLHEMLRNRGLTLGHEPDSWEFSTLGGWLATKASGMKKNVYGNIEDVVVNITMVTAQGTMRKSCNVPRASMGPDIVQASLGSEGIFGIFTQAMLTVRAYPSHKVYDSLLFPDFAHGITALNEVMRQKCIPASIRLLDNVQFQLGQALKPSPSKSSSQLATGVKSLSTSVIDLAKKTYVTKIKGFDPNTLCAATVLMEGTKEEVESQQSKIRAIARKNQGLIGGAENGQRGYFFTYIIAYLRDFAMDYYFLSESFETCVPWTNIRQLCSDLKKAISSEAAKKNVVVPPLVCCRVTQLYETGVCVYVYYGINYYGIKDPLCLFKTIEDIAVEVIIANGGSLSHHHGVGKHRQKWLQGTISSPGVQAIRGIKQALDPNNIFATGNLLTNSRTEK